MSSAEPEQSGSSKKQKPSFGSLGLIQPLLEAIERLEYKTPTDIQLEALPPALEGRDIIGVASTGSGKTAAFAMGVRCTVLVGGMDMVTQSIALAKKPHIVMATPGRLKDHLENTKGFSLRGLRFLVSEYHAAIFFPYTCVARVQSAQAVRHTPQVLDEADRLLDMDFGADIDAILRAIPKERTTYLYSATMTTKVAKLQRASLSNPVRVEVSTK